jgi:hypothetical protein
MGKGGGLEAVHDGEDRPVYQSPTEEPGDDQVSLGFTTTV